MNTTLQQFQAFLKDPEAPELFITGVAGTGKTTSLRELLQCCLDSKIKTIATAYTHKACLVLKSNLPKRAPIATLHSFLKKCPTINDTATKVTHVDGNAIAGESIKVDVLFIDEFSMVGEKDYVDINDLIYNDEGEIVMKVVYIGDPNQLPPVKDMAAIEPHGDHWIKLTKVYRQKGDNKLIDTLLKLNDYINGIPAEPLQEHETFVRKQNIIELYKQCNKAKVLLAYTNATVEYLNAEIQGRDFPLEGDELFSPTIRHFYTLVSETKDPFAIINIRNEIVEMYSKYRTLETLKTIEGVKFFIVADGEGLESPRAVVFGHQRYLDLQKKLANKAVRINKKIKAKYNVDPKEWARANWKDPLCKERSAAWRNYLALKNNVICIDFVHAMTVHKSQGSTYENVFLDTEDMGRCADMDYQMYLKLLYVAVSRASHKVYTN